MRKPLCGSGKNASIANNYLLTQQLELRGVEVERYDFAQVLKSEEEINAMIDPQLEWDKKKDPTILYGSI